MHIKTSSKAGKTKFKFISIYAWQFSANAKFIITIIRQKKTGTAGSGELHDGIWFKFNTYRN